MPSVWGKLLWRDPPTSSGRRAIWLRVVETSYPPRKAKPLATQDPVPRFHWPGNREQSMPISFVLVCTHTYNINRDDQTVTCYGESSHCQRNKTWRQQNIVTSRKLGHNNNDEDGNNDSVVSEHFLSRCGIRGGSNSDYNSGGGSGFKSGRGHFLFCAGSQSSDGISASSSSVYKTRNI